MKCECVCARDKLLLYLHSSNYCSGNLGWTHKTTRRGGVPFVTNLSLLVKQPYSSCIIRVIGENLSWILTIPFEGVTLDHTATPNLTTSFERPFPCATYIYITRYPSSCRRKSQLDNQLCLTQLPLIERLSAKPLNSVCDILIYVSPSDRTIALHQSNRSLPEPSFECIIRYTASYRPKSEIKAAREHIHFKPVEWPSSSD